MGFDKSPLKIGKKISAVSYFIYAYFSSYAVLSNFLHILIYACPINCESDISS